MSVEREAFLEIMTAFPTGVGVVTTVDGDGNPWGLTSNAISSVSADPPTLLVCVARTSRSLPALLARKGFLVNFMAEDAADTCRLFASKASSEEKFAVTPWEPSEAGHPRLTESSIAFADCETVSEIEAETHLILVGRVIDGAVTSERLPVAYFRREFLTWSASSR